MEKNKSEKLVWNIISKYGKNLDRWEFVEFFDESGNSRSQAVNCSGVWISYPDYKKKNNDKTKVIMFVEVKGYDGYFAGIDYGLGIKIKQFHSYSKIQKQENSQVRVCFIIWCDNHPYLFWETLNNMKNMEKQILKNYQYSPYIPATDYYVFDCREFRNDYETIPVFGWDE